MHNKAFFVGITYDLKDDYLSEGFSKEEAAEFDRLHTIEAIDNALQQMGLKTQRIGNVKKLAAMLVAGHRWDFVFNICEGMYGIGREAQVPALLDAYNIPYVFSNVLVLSLTLHKGFTKQIIRDANIPTAPFFVVNNPDEIDLVNLPYPLFAKPVAEGTGKGIDTKSKIHDKSQLIDTCLFLLQKFKQPVLVETYLPGREFTVGIAGNGAEAKSVGIMEIHFKSPETEQIYSFNSKDDWRNLLEYAVPEPSVVEICEKVALDAWRVLGCADGGRVDLRMDANNIPNFIEVNPLAGIDPIESDLPMLARMQGIQYQQLMEMIVHAAIKRIFKFNNV